MRALVIAPDKSLGTSKTKNKDGRWSILRRNSTLANGTANEPSELCAIQLLRRYGVVFRRLFEREPVLPSWREILYVLRRLEARGEICSGCFVAGFPGEQYALPEAIQVLRAILRHPASGQFITISGAAPLNLACILTPDEKVASSANNRLLFRDGIPIAAREAEMLVELHQSAKDFQREMKYRLR